MPSCTEVLKSKVQGFGTVDHAAVQEPPRHILRPVPVIQSIDHRHSDLRIRIYRYCIPGIYLVLFHRSSTDSSLYPKNCMANRRASTMCRHRQKLLLFRATRTSAYCRILSGSPACRLAGQSTGNTSPHSNRMETFPPVSLFGQGELS